MELLDTINRLQKKRQQIDHERNRLEHIKAKAVRITSAPFDGLPHGGGYTTSKVENNAIRVVSVEEGIEKLEREYIRTEAQLYEQLTLEPDSKARVIIILRYVHGYKWSDCARMISKDTDISELRKYIKRYFEREEAEDEKQES